ncbi:hypothetical protein [Streptomyces sp. AA1529]
MRAHETIHHLTRGPCYWHDPEQYAPKRHKATTSVPTKSLFGMP